MTGEHADGEAAYAASAEHPLDLAFLEEQTFGDLDLERDVLSLFLDQGRRVLQALETRSTAGRADDAHLLKGSSRGIGAFAMGRAAEAYGANPDDEHLSRLRAAFDTATLAINSRLAEIAAAAPPVHAPAASLKGP